MRNIGFLFVLILISLSVKAQYPPPAGQDGTTAIHKDSSIFIDWANNCIVQRGHLDISDPELGLVTAGEDFYAIGIADNLIVSLGDEGKAILSFDKPIQNGPGPDFAVFENSFSDDFLELAFVEVSSNGIDFVRFPSISLTQTEEQIDAYGLLDATKINNLAGKYRGVFGVPFDLEDIELTELFDEYLITHIRIISVTGSIGSEFASCDSQGNAINDPWPTIFPSGGFDLDAVGVINNSSNSTHTRERIDLIRIFPNPVEKYLNFQFLSDKNPIAYSILDVFGEFIETESFPGLKSSRINIEQIPSGIYFIRIYFQDFQTTQKFIKN